MGPLPFRTSPAGNPASIRAIALGNDQSQICAMASFTDTSTNWPAPVCLTLVQRAQSRPNAPVIEAASSTRCPGGSNGESSGMPALNAKPPLAARVASVAAQSA